MTKTLHQMIREGGPRLFYVSIALCVLAALVLAWSGFNAVKEAHDHVARPIAAELQIGLVHEQCPGGWKDVTSEGTENLLTRACLRNDWLVLLDENGKFNYAVPAPGEGSQFIYDESKVPDWH